MSDNTSIKVENVTKVYNLYEKPVERLKEALLFSKKSYHSDYYALNNVSFEVKRGETFGIIGTNGAGKSTLLKMITGVAKPSDGLIAVKGKISALLELGAGFNVEYTGIQNIYLNGTMMGYKKEEMGSKVKKIMEFADIGEFIHQPVKTYSSGMFARLAFAVAINVEPEVLIVDEALSVGDVFFQNKCYHKFEELRSKGTTVLFVSHDILSVKQMCSRVLWLEKGVVQMIGDAREVCEAYSTARMQITNEQNQQIVESIDVKEVEKIEEVAVPQLVPKVMECADGIFSDKVKILSTFLMDDRGEIVKEVECDQRYSINIMAEFSEEMQGVIFGFSIESIKGIRILGENTYASCDKVYEATKGEIILASFEFVFPCIETGNYLLSPAVAVGTQETPVILTWLNSIEQIRVERQGYNLALLGMRCEVNTRHVKNVKFY